MQGFEDRIFGNFWDFYVIFRIAELCFKMRGVGSLGFRDLLGFRVWACLGLRDGVLGLCMISLMHMGGFPPSISMKTRVKFDVLDMGVSQN